MRKKEFLFIFSSFHSNKERIFSFSSLFHSVKVRILFLLNEIKKKEKKEQGSIENNCNLIYAE